MTYLTQIMDAIERVVREADDWNYYEALRTAGNIAPETLIEQIQRAFQGYRESLVYAMTFRGHSNG